MVAYKIYIFLILYVNSYIITTYTDDFYDPQTCFSYLFYIHIFQSSVAKQHLWHAVHFINKVLW